MITRLPFLVVALFALVGSAPLRAELWLPKIFSDNMVLQRDQPIALWGTAEPGERVRINFGSIATNSIADEQGKWTLEIPAMPASSQPRSLTIRSDRHSFAFQNILVGDVWLCSGQSNMEWPLSKVRDADQELAAARYPTIRHFQVANELSFTPQEDLPGGKWVQCSPDTAGSFTAVGYFFARKLTEELNVPIGLIHSSWGGTGIESWTSWAVMSQFSEYKDIDQKKLQDQMETAAKQRPLYEAALEEDRGLADAWFQPDTDLAQWRPVSIPGFWSDTPIGDADGIAWFRLDFDLPAELASKKATLNLGPIDDEDATYLNGNFIGSETAYDKRRVYAISPSITKPGSNTLVVKIVDTGGRGGFYGKTDEMYLEVEGKKISLAGKWQYRASVLTSDFDLPNIGPNVFPSVLYNAMINPLIHTPIKGVIWYQGENNAQQAHAYRTRFPAMIKDWRRLWGRDFPFYWAQLANFQNAVKTPVNSAWAELREAQDMALALPNTGQAILIDIGEAQDVHPTNKQDVGLRLALAALHQTYGKDVVFSGPRFKSMTVEGSEAILTFEHTDGGLVAKGDSNAADPGGFAIAGKDRKFHWANARIEGETIVVSNPKVHNPVAVRYAWADNPDKANLYNGSNLPAAPFRTDNWPGVTDNR